MPLYINGHDRTVTLLPKAKGIMVGGLPNQVYKEERQDGKQYQLERLAKTLVAHQDRGVGEIAKVSVIRLLSLLIEHLKKMI